MLFVVMFWNIFKNVSVFWNNECLTLNGSPICLFYYMYLNTIVYILMFIFFPLRNRSKWCIRIWVEQGSRVALWEKRVVKRKSVAKYTAWNTERSGVRNANGKKRALDSSGPSKTHNWRNENDTPGTADADNLHQFTLTAKIQMFFLLFYLFIIIIMFFYILLYFYQTLRHSSVYIFFSISTFIEVCTPFYVQTNFYLMFSKISYINIPRYIIIIIIIIVLPSFKSYIH